MPAAADGKSGDSQREEKLMHAVVRTYSGKGAKELADLIDKRKGDV
jgi:hypothetical protein